ncbi:hypothetical protein EW026_g5102 [Hermanssonia centrifuga]|uniref:Peptide hydrolase n=1 Tax=Hermanssonia centrifuga TaxID=98765 RepID=A0A4S4KJI3_9APHY|nr:hypothetical protein EW026_g5102 [Hermanssonia centrifuga]
MVATFLGAFSLLVTQADPFLLHEKTPCLGVGYYGSSYSGKYHFFGTSDNACVDLATSSSLMQPVTVHAGDSSQLVWLEKAAVDPSVISGESFSLDLLIQNLQALSPRPLEEQQQVLGAIEEPFFEVLNADDISNTALLRMGRTMALSIDTHLPPVYRSMLIPSTPMSLIPVSSPAIGRVQEILSHVKFDPSIAGIVNNISLPQMQNDIRFLTGEDPKSSIVSRHSFSDGVLVAAQWLKDRFEETGAECALEPFLSGFAPNVICEYSATINTTETVLLSAHYDSRGSFGSTRAPGGDDDGSGTIALLAIARTIARKGITFKKNVQLVAFAGEEQGLLGSRAYARQLRAADADLVLMVQADMLGYHKAGEPAQLGLPETIGTLEVTQLVANLSAIYSPELKVGFTPACCSDHQSFHEQGFPATQVFERAGPIVDPMYHNSGDLSDREGYDFEQIKSIAKVQFATLLHAAGFDLDDKAHHES